MRHFQCLKSSAGNPLAVEKGPGSIAPLWAELWPFKEGNRQRRTKSDANVTDFVTTFSNAHKSGWEWTFEALPVPKIISRSIAPQGTELWPFKEGYRLLNFSRIGEDRSSVFKHSFLSLEWSFAKIQKPRTIRMRCSFHGTGTQDSGTSGRQATAR